MPINPLIASGGTPFDVSNALFKMGDGQRQDRAVQVAEERNALVDRRWQAQDAQQQAALAKEAEEDAAFDAARLKGDWDAMAAIDPDTTKVLWQFQEARKPPVQPGPIQTQRMPDGATFYTQDGKSIGSRMPQAPQRPAPETFSPFTQADGTVVMLGSRGTERPTNLKGAPKSAPLTTAQSAVDKSFAPEYAKFVTGGAADAQKALDELRGVQSQLKSGEKNLTGWALGKVPLGSRAMFNQDSVDAEETVANTVQRSLRVILGAQFTEKEGENLIRRAYNPQLSEAKNAERVGRLVTQLERSFKAKQEAAQYYEQNGSLVGYQGKTDFSLADFDVDGSASGGTGGWSIEEVP
jgi:hypothetical protein